MNWTRFGFILVVLSMLCNLAALALFVYTYRTTQKRMREKTHTMAQWEKAEAEQWNVLGHYKKKPFYILLILGFVLSVAGQLLQFVGKLV